MRPIIKDKETRDILRKWAIKNQIPEVVCRIGTYDHGGVCMIDGVIQFTGVIYRICIQFENTEHRRLKDKEVYSVYDLVGDEE